VPTTSAALTRLKDELEYTGLDGNIVDNQRRSVSTDILFQDFNTGTTRRLVGLNDGGSNNDRVLMYLPSGPAGVMNVVSRATGEDNGDRGTVTDIVDGEKHTITMFCEDDNLVGDTDGISSLPDESCGMPSYLDRFDIGSDPASAIQQPNCLLQNLRIYGYRREDD